MGSEAKLYNIWYIYNKGYNYENLSITYIYAGI